MKKIIIFMKLYWIQIIVITITLFIIISGVLYTRYVYGNYMLLEDFTRRQISGTMAVYMPMFLFVQIFTMPIYFAMYFYMMRGGGMGKVSFERNKPNVKWSDVIGLEEAKKEAWELVKLLKDRSLLKRIGGKIIKGTMFLGPPGCGKTFLAKAIAAEADLPLISTVGSEFVGMFVGQGTARMKSLFKQARALAKLNGGCIIFIDEIDSFARPRRSDNGFGGQMSMNSTINQFLTEMDGLRNAENSIAVIAATNASEKDLDSAIMRAGRFDRKVHVKRPNLKEREDIFTLYLDKIEKDENVSANIMARKTVGFSPAEIESTVRESSLIANRDGREAISMKDLGDAYERVSFGQKSNITLTDKEKYMTAYHETGHAILYYLVHPTNDVMKASVIPRGSALGFVFARPEEDTHGHDRKDLIAEIKIAIASYVVELKKFNTSTTGVGGGSGSDFFSAMRIAERMVVSYGMGKSGLIGDFTASNILSEKTRAQLDSDIQEILQSCLKDVTKTINTHWDCVSYFAEELYKKEELDFDEIEAIFTEKFGLTRAKDITKK